MLMCIARLSMLAVAIPLLLAASLARAAPADEPDATVMRAIVARVIAGYAQPAAHAFDTAAQRLVAETQAACRAGGKPPDAMRAAFRDLANAWGRLSAARLGPLAADSRMERLAFWPDGRGMIARQTRQLAPALPADEAEARAWLGRQSAAVQGLPAFDLIGFADDAATACGMPQAIAGNITHLAGEVAAGFADEGGLALLSPAPDNPQYKTPREAAAEVLRALSTQAQVLRTVMIQVPLGPRPEDGKVSRFFLRFAPATRPFLAGAVDGLAEMLAALAPYVGAGDGNAAVASAQHELKTARAMLEAIPDEPASMLAEPARGKLVTAMLALEGFDRLVTGRIGAALGLQTGFNALDGD